MKKIVLKKVFFLVICMLFCFKFINAQNNYTDVVYLKNGSIIKGVIIEQIPNQTLKIQTKEGNVFVYKIEEVEKITKEKEIEQIQPVQQGQQVNSPIKIERRRFYQNGQMLSLHELKTILKNNPASKPELQNYKVNAAVGNTLLSVGSFLVGYGIGYSLASSIQQTNNLSNGTVQSSNTIGVEISLIGLAFDIISIPLLISANHHLKKSVSLYNSSFKSVSLNPVRLNMLVNQNGLGIRMSF